MLLSGHTFYTSAGVANEVSRRNKLEGIVTPAAVDVVFHMLPKFLPGEFLYRFLSFCPPCFDERIKIRRLPKSHCTRRDAAMAFVCFCLEAFCDFLSYTFIRRITCYRDLLYYDQRLLGRP